MQKLGWQLLQLQQYLLLKDLLWARALEEELELGGLCCQLGADPVQQQHQDPWRRALVEQLLLDPRRLHLLLLEEEVD